MVKYIRISFLSPRIFLLGILILYTSAGVAQTVNPATGGDNISADDAASGAWTPLVGPEIIETSPGQLTAGDIRLRVPDGFEWDTGGTAPSVNVVAPRSQEITVTFISRTATEVVFNLEGSSGGTPPNNPHTLTFQDLRIRPTDGTPLASGAITNAGSSAPGGNTSYGNLSMTQGADYYIRVETTPDAEGLVVDEQSLKAGSSLTVYSNIRDQFGNFKRNEAADSWSLNGNIPASALIPAADNKSAKLMPEQKGTTSITAAFAGLTTVNSGDITVTAADPANLVLVAQPGDTATAGEPFASQPVIEVHDQFGNLVAGDDYTQVTAQRDLGDGQLQGNTIQTAEKGIITFQDLSHNVANDITISFSSNMLPTVTSDTITVIPGPAAGLTFIKQPSNDIVNEPLDPPPEVQLLDAYGNFVLQEEIAITTEKVEGSGNISGSGTATEITNSNGVAIFDNIKFDAEDIYVIRATSDGLTDSEDSNPFSIAGEGVLADFEFEMSGGGSIDTLTAGDPFDIQITAVDGNGHLLNGSKGSPFNEKVWVDSPGQLLSGNDSTDTFQDGVLSSHTVNFSSAGTLQLSATNSTGVITGWSNEFFIKPAAASVTNSYFEVNRDSITADGNDTSEITVVVRDEFENQLIEGNENVEIQLNGSGTISAVTDNNDGTYTAKVTAPTNVGSADITATLNGSSINSKDGNTQETIAYIPGPVSTFLLKDTSSESSIISEQTAGQAFDIKITAQDAHENTVISFDETVEISSSGNLSEGEGTTAAFVNGVLSSHTVNITTADSNTTLSARRTSYSEEGTSEPFIVNPGAAEPAVSRISSARTYLANNGTDNTTIEVQLKDEFGNNLTKDIRDSGDTITLNTNGASATLSGIQYISNGVYAATLTSSTTVETVTITGSVNGTAIGNSVDIDITEINRWTAAAGGRPGNDKDWSNTQNWSLNSLPEPGQIVLISPQDDVGNDVSGFPILDPSNQTVVNPIVDFLVIEEGANLTMSQRNLTIQKEISGGGSIYSVESNITLLGDSNISNFIAGSSDITLNGDSEQHISGDFTANQLDIQQSVSVNGYLEAFSPITVAADQVLTAEQGAQLVAYSDMVINGSLVGNNATFRFGGDITGNNIALQDATVEFDGSAPQELNILGNFKNLIIDNPTSVTANTDVIISGTLTIDEGVLIISSGNNLIANEKSGNTQNIRLLRELSGNPGWRMLSVPVSTTYEDFLDGTLTQGYLNSQLGNAPEDSLQPNVLFYDETYKGTDNQRWRAPQNATDNVAAGRGHFVYLFGDITEDNRYNNALPDTLDMQGEEFDGDGSSFTFPVTYTAEADTGWNLVGNPFAAAIDWDDGKWVKENVDNSIYVWDPETNDYLTWNGISGSLGSGLISPFQAFWVKANGEGDPKLSVSKESKTTGADFKGKNKREPAALGLTLHAKGKTTSTHITLTSDGKTDKDRRDAYHLLPFNTDTYLELYTTTSDGTELSINNLARKFGKELSIPVHVGGYENGHPITEEFILSWPEFGDIPDSWTLILEDRKTGTEIDLRKNSFYSFDLSGSRQKQVATNTVHNFNLIRSSQSKPKGTGADSESRFLLRIDPGTDGEGIPDDYALGINYPNPFGENTRIKFETPLEGNVTLIIYDVLGRKIKTLVDERYKAGYHEYQWNPSQLASGVYICLMKAGGKTFTKKLTYIK